MKRITLTMAIGALLASLALTPAIGSTAQKSTTQSKQVKKPASSAKNSAVRTGTKKATAKKKKARPAVAQVERPSYGKMAGLHGTSDSLELKSSVALVVDQDTQEVLFSKNDHAVLPIASIPS